MWLVPNFSLFPPGMSCGACSSRYPAALTRWLSQGLTCDMWVLPPCSPAPSLLPCSLPAPPGMSCGACSSKNPVVLTRWLSQGLTCDMLDEKVTFSLMFHSLTYSRHKKFFFALSFGPTGGQRHFRWPCIFNSSNLSTTLDKTGLNTFNSELIRPDGLNRFKLG